MYKLTDRQATLLSTLEIEQIIDISTLSNDLSWSEQSVKVVSNALQKKGVVEVLYEIAQDTMLTVAKSVKRIS